MKANSTLAVASLSVCTRFAGPAFGQAPDGGNYSPAQFEVMATLATCDSSSP